MKSAVFVGKRRFGRHEVRFLAQDSSPTERNHLRMLAAATRFVRQMWVIACNFGYQYIQG